jgi:hypothetical protein
MSIYRWSEDVILVDLPEQVELLLSVLRLTGVLIVSLMDSIS